MLPRALVLTLAVLPWLVHAQTDAQVDIPPGQRLPLNVLIKGSDTSGAAIVLYEKDGQCAVQVTALHKKRNGKQVDVPLQLPAPCDVMTRGATAGFEPRVRTTADPAAPQGQLLTVRVVGGLKYVPSWRAECGSQWRDVVISTARGQVEFSDTYREAHKDLLFCPRFYNPLTWWSGMDW